jgi:hypothetical protein
VHVVLGHDRGDFRQRSADVAGEDPVVHAIADANVVERAHLVACHHSEPSCAISATERRHPCAASRGGRKTTDTVALGPAAMMRETAGMNRQSRFTAEQARAIGEAIGIDWTTSRFDVEQFRMGLEVELEHGRHDPATNVTDDDEGTTGKIAWAHLNEFPDYYTRLAAMEAEAERYWSEQGKTA